MSDSNMARRSGIVVGTAGHIDHGKTSLIRALTGVDTDRLAEEKRRGISIDLGFAHLDLPGGQSVSFVDVPGHERFIRNMLAGAAGIEAVLLIIAADESVKPQTREHFEICRLLNIERGIVVLTKTDLVSDAQLAVARAAACELVAGSFLQNAPVIPVSAATRSGLDMLSSALSMLSKGKMARRVDGFARLPLDRSFPLKGFGTVVTGTLSSGALHIGDNVHIQPLGKTARIRGLQVHGASVESAFAGERIAVNLNGVDHSELNRGHTLLAPAGLELTRLLQGSVRWLGDFSPAAREDLVLHIGTAEIPVRLKLLAKGSPSLVQLQLQDPALATPGDRFVLRRPSPSQTIGGGVVIEAFPPRLNRTQSAARVARLAPAPLSARLEILVAEKKDGRTISELVRFAGETSASIQQALVKSEQLLFVEAGQRIVSRTWLAHARERVVRTLREFHTANPSAEGMPLSQLRFGMEPALAQFVLGGFADVRVAGDKIALAAHRPRVSSQETAALAKFEQLFRAAGYQPPPPAQVPRPVLEQLIKSGKLVRVSQELVFHADVIDHIRRSLAVHKGRRFSIPEFKEWTQISRKYAVPLLEFLDHQHITKREGDLRVIL
jgi:selenocysteine-specific elongation factor